MGNHVIHVPTVHVNLSPVLFLHLSRDYFECHLSSGDLKGSSPVPFFLCCRAIELGLKAKHLETATQAKVKVLFSHDLEKAYEALDTGQKTLTQQECGVLAAANAIYKVKEFEYVHGFDALTAYKRFPALDDLADLARKITEYDR
jgi:hypothetical protein